MLALCRFTGFDDAEIMFPLGGDDLATDLRICGEYAVVAGAQLDRLTGALLRLHRVRRGRRDADATAFFAATRNV